MQAYLLGGRAYGSAATQPTFAQRGWLMGLMREHKLDRVIDRNGDLLTAVLKAGCASDLLAGLLTEDRKPWHREDAEKNAAYFDGLTEPSDAQQLLDALAFLLADFFPHRGSSSTASPTSSTRPPRQTASRGRKPRRPVTTPESSTETSPASSPPSVSAPAGA